MQFHQQSLLLVVGPQVGGGNKDPPQQSAHVIVPLEVLTQFARQRTLRAVSNHFDGIDEVLTLGTQLPIALGLRQILQRHLPWGFFALLLEIIEQSGLGLNILP